MASTCAVVEHRLADHRAAAHDEIEHALGNAGAHDDLGQRMRRAGHEIGGLEHDACCRRQSAGAIFQAGIAIGKFHGAMMPTTPTASRVTSTSTPGRTLANFSPGMRSASPAKKSKICAARSTSPIASGSVLPSSRASSPPSSSRRARISRRDAQQNVVPLLRRRARPGGERRARRGDRGLDLGGVACA